MSDDDDKQKDTRAYTEQVLRKFAATLGKEFTPEIPLSDYMDSLDIYEMVMEIEEELLVLLSEEYIATSCSTGQHVVDYVAKVVGAVEGGKQHGN